MNAQTHVRRAQLRACVSHLFSSILTPQLVQNTALGSFPEPHIGHVTNSSSVSRLDLTNFSDITEVN